MAKFGSVELPVSDGVGPFVPEDIGYSEHGKILETVAYALRENLPALLVGETGVGKTSAIRHLAARTGHGLRRVNVNGSMTAEDFIGQLLVNKDGTYWKDGVLTECMRAGYWLVVDEINAASAEILFALHSLLDDDRYIVLTDHPEREIVKAHPDFRIIATMNPPERYAGTKEMNRALLSRFALMLSVPIPPAKVEYGPISGATETLGDVEVKKLRKFTDEMRAAYTREEIDVFISPRDTAHIVKLYDFTGNLPDAIELCVAGRGTEAERKAIMHLVALHFAPKPEEEAAAA